MARKKILLLITNLTFGGAQRVFFQQSRLLAEDHDVIECVFNLADGHAFVSGNPVISLDVPAGRNLPDKIFRFCQRVLRVRQLKRVHRFDFCISHLEGADLVNVLAGSRSNTICWVHGSKLHDKNIEGIIGWLRHRILIPLTYRCAGKIVTVSKAIAKELTDSYHVADKFIVPVYNYFDISQIHHLATLPLEEDYSVLFSTGPTMVLTGRLARQKNYHTFIIWFAQFQKIRPCKVIILGDGELRDTILKQCYDLRLRVYQIWTNMKCTPDFDVYFLGYQSNPFRFVQRSTLFMLPSLWEGFPMALGEAMACGVPVVSSDCPTGPREFLCEDPDLTSAHKELNAEYGLLLPVLTEKTFQEWNNAINSLLKNESTRSHYATMARHRVAAFSYERFVQEVKAILAT